MRTPLVVAIVLLLPLVPLPTVSAQAPGGHLLTDDKGDTAYSTGPGPSVPYSGQGADAADLLSLDLVESDEAFALTLGVASVASGGGQYSVFFSWHDIDFTLEAFRNTPTFGSFQSATLYSSDGSGFERVASIPMTVDPASNSMTFTIQKVFVLDGAKHAPQRGDVLKNFHVFAEEPTVGNFNFGGNNAAGIASAFDMMPNSGDGASAEMKLGDVQAGTISLSTPDRIRVSNGGATTFVFQSIVRNNGTREDEVDLKVTDLPENWIANVQSPLRVPAHGEKQIAVLVSVPFAHVHGGFSSFNMSATSKRDPANHASMRLGVLHTPIPQPAGHHQELYLHGHNQNNGIFGSTPAGNAFSFAQGYFNTEAAHDGDVDVFPNGNSNGALAWSLPLNPGLSMGVDMDLNKTGSLAGSVFGKQQGTGTISAKLYLVRAKGQSNQSNSGNQDQGILLMDGKGVKVTYDLQKPTPFALSLTPTDAADYVPYAKGQNLVLVIKAASDQANPCCFGFVNEPLLSSKDFKMVLPLNEYNDVISGTPDVATGLDLQNVGPIEKVGRPGTIMTYQFSLVNTAGNDAVVQVDVAGNDAKLGSLVPQGRVTLGPNENRRLTLAVHIPSDAPLGKDLEVLVFAHAQDDPSKMAIARTKTTVATGANATDDETGVLIAARQAEKKSPGVETLGALAVVGLAAVLLSRRRR